VRKGKEGDGRGKGMQKEGRERKGSYWYFFSPSSSPDLKTKPVNCMLCPVVMVMTMTA